MKRICQDLEHRRLPFLVDMGGRPQAAQTNIFNQCTHSVLLLRTDKDDYTQLWQGLVAENGLLPLAEIYSQLEGASTITAETPVLKGILAGLKRHSKISVGGQLFDALVERIATLFNSYSPLELETVFFEQAPTEYVLNLYQSLRTIDPVATDWELAMLEPL